MVWLNRRRSDERFCAADVRRAVRNRARDEGTVAAGEPSPEALHRVMDELDRFVNRSAGRLPSAAVVGARHITDLMRAVIDTADVRALDVYTVMSVRGIAGDYLPTTLSAYLAVDPSVHDLPRASGRTPTQSLLEQVDVLRRSAAATLDSATARDADALMTQGSFLRTKFSRSDLDLSSPAAPAVPAPAVSAPAVPAPGSPAAPAPSVGRVPTTVLTATTASPPEPTFGPRRMLRGASMLLTPQWPSVTLTRVQSSVGRLILTAATSVGDGDLRLGCAYRLRSGSSSLVQAASQVTVAPPASPRPLIRATRQRFEELHVDLRQVGELDRMVVYLFSQYDALRTSPPGVSARVPWAGVLSAELVAATRIDVPLRRDPAPGVLVALSIYNVDGELVLRTENQLLPGSVREAVQAFGFDAIAWIDPTTPLT